MANTNFKFECPYCGQHLEAEPDMAGMEFDCPGCDKSITVPTPQKTGTAVIIPTAPGNVSRPQSPVIQTISIDNTEATQPIITVVRKRGGFFAKNRQWLVPVIGGAAAILLVLGVVAAKQKSSRRHRPHRSPSSYSPPSSTATLTSRERNAIGKIMYSIGMIEANRQRLTKEMTASHGAATAEILVGLSAMILAAHIEDEEGWADCPYDFRTAVRESYIANAKSHISNLAAKYGRNVVIDTLKGNKVHDDYLIGVSDILNTPPSSIAKELASAQANYRACLAKYGINSNDIETLAVNEFKEQRMSASGLCKEFVGDKTYFTYLDNHTVTWDPGGETPPFICMVSFKDDGTASLIQDNTFFARDYSRIPMATLAQRLEQAFPKANYNANEYMNVSAEVRNGHLYFGGEVKVEPGNVEEKVIGLFKALNQARIFLRIY